MTGERRAAAEWLAVAHGLTAGQVPTSPSFLSGDVEPIVEDLLALRERDGISYLSIFPGDVDTFAPVVARLAGR